MTFYDAWCAGAIRPVNGWACWDCGEQWATRKAVSIPVHTGVDEDCDHRVLHATHVRVAS